MIRDINRFASIGWLLAAGCLFSANTPAFSAGGHTSNHVLLTIQAPAELRAHALQRDLGSETVSSWHVSVDFAAFNSIRAPDGSRVAIGSNINIGGQRLTLQIPERPAPLSLIINTVYESDDGVINYAGIIEGDDGSLVVISVYGQEILGKVHHAEGFTYLIESQRNTEGYTLSIIDQTLIPRQKHKYEQHSAPDGRDSSQFPFSPASGEKIEMSASGSGNVRLLVLYTPALAAEINVNLLANNIVSSFNHSLLLSGVQTSNYMTLAEVRSIGDNLSTWGSRCNGPILFDSMIPRDGPFSNLDSWMADAYADMALVTLTTEPSYQECSSLGRIGGIGYPINNYPQSGSPFSITTHTFAMADLTAIHEIGHALNGMHEVPYDCNVGYFGQGTEPHYACGYAPSHCGWQTMMGGYIQCGFDYGQEPGQQPTVRIARWSNPDLLYDGEPTGVAGTFPGDPDKRNMAMALDVNMPHASTWKGELPTPPAAPNPFQAQTYYCWGLNDASWTSQTGATQYRLFGSTSHGFANRFLLYSGPSTTFTVNVDQNTHLRVQACNAGGCSPDSSTVLAQYFSACL